MSIRHHLNGSSIAIVAVFAALIAASTLAPEITIAAGVPFSLQTFAVVLTGLALGPWRAVAATGLYVVVGLAGAPIFANGRAGLAVLVGPTGGFLVGMLAAAFVVGLLTRWIRNTGELSWWRLLLPALVSVPVVYAIGIPWLAVVADMSLGAATTVMLPFIPWDAAKAVLAAGAAAVIHRAWPQLMPRTVRTKAVEREGAATA